ncbi:MAG: diguanylate cyclase [Clostridium sp.]|jgi:diguanylate cyclase (GGDEF)-like protein|nr:diguanylate cyclase [Clostridium sp.]
MIWKTNLLGKRIKNLNEQYFSDWYKKSEITFYILICIVMGIIQSSNADHDAAINIRGYISHIQSTIVILMAFRYGYFGFLVSSVLIATETFFIIRECFVNFDNYLLLGLTLKLFTILIACFIAVLTNRQQIQNRKLEIMAITDELTGAYNQRFFHMILDDGIKRAQKNKCSVGLIMIDVDNFKMYNDIYGHDFGDEILKSTAAILKKIVKEESYVFRCGGDEFAVIFRNTDLQHLESMANNLRKEFERLKKDYYRDDIYDKVTLSIGLSEYPNMSKSKDELVYQADMALYHAKNLGKDKVHLYQDAILQLRKNISSDHQQLIGIFKGLLSTISAKDKYTHGHCERVSAYGVMIGEALNMSLKEISIIQYAGLLHDIGKIEMPKNILNKKEELTEEEKNYLRQHPIYSENILEPLGEIDLLTDYVRHHHERYDGKGYPDGLAGAEISLGARILCVADSFDAMVSERPYSKSMTMEQAFKELEKNAGTQFDPEIVKIFIKIMKARAA